MGKMKSRRQKLHTSAVKLRKRDEAKKTSDSTNAAVEVVEMDSNTGVQGMLQSPLAQPENMFGGLKIDMSAVHKDLPDFDARSTITSKTTKGLNLTKKDKRKLKHEFWMKKVDTIQTVRLEEKAKKKRQKTPVVGDMRLLADTLPTLDLLLKETVKTAPRDNTKSELKTKKGTQKAKVRQKQMLADMSGFKQVLQHEAYKSNPRATISEHLHNWQKQEMGDN